MPQISKERLDALLLAGHRLSNICFTLSQDKENENASIMRECYQDWDRAYSDAKKKRAKEPNHA